MTPAQWDEIRAHFDAAVDLDEIARADYLLKRCADPLMRRQVSLMLMADEEDNDDLSRIVQGAANESFTPSIKPGTMLGAFEIVDDIDHGGMGSVYLAKRADDEYEQHVAIKVVNVALAGGQLLSRFKSERQILARLEHPNIARLIDGGTTEAGAPYLVMEYVQGVAIDQYCDDNELTTVQRLELFMQVCAAIHVAHQNLVVHRDIKPANILVTPQGEPKLLDFGIAKLLDPAASGATAAVTQANMRLFTPLYASPEQVQGKNITTASDVYSLGVLLYTLLLGTSPYQINDGENESLLAAICTAQPVRPSTRVTTVAADAGDEVFNARGTTAAGLRKRLRGDLDNIVLMALRKEPERRYESARALAADIKNYLRNRPVSARQDTLGYRLGKYLQRNAAAVSVGTVAILGMVTLATFYTLKLAEQRDRAQRAAVEATQTADFLQNLFRVTDPNESNGESVTARSLLEQGARQLEATLKDQPGVRAALQTTIGKVYTSLGLRDNARGILDQSLRTLESQSAPSRAAMVDVLVALTRVQIMQDQHVQALASANRALALANESATDDVLPFDSELALVEAMMGAGDYATISARLERLLEQLTAAGLQDDILYAKALTTLGQSYDVDGKFAETTRVMRGATELYEQSLGDIHSATIYAQRTLAMSLDRQQRYDEAKSILQKALASSQKLYGNQHADIAEIQGELGTVYRHAGDMETAMRYIEAALETSQHVLGPDHSDVAYDMVALANLGYPSRGMTFAEPLFREALEIYDRTLPGDHPVIAAAHVAYGYRLILEARYAEAQAQIEPGHAIALRALGEEHWLTAQFDVLRGIIARRQNNEALATPLLISGFDRVHAARGIAHGATKSALTELLENLQAVGDTETYERYASLLDDSE